MELRNASGLPVFKRKHHFCWRTGWIRSGILMLFFGCAILDMTNAQGKPASRRWSVRKTGEFGRKVGIAGDNVPSASSSSSSSSSSPSPSSFSSRLLSQELQLPTETRRYSKLEAGDDNGEQYFRGAGDNPSRLEIRKPSLGLELPRFGGGGAAHHQNFVALPDQEAQETEDNEGYAYPKPGEEEVDSSKGYDYPSPAVKPVESLGDDSSTVPPEEPDPSQPEIISRGNQIFTPLETDEDVDADALRRTSVKLPKSDPNVVGLSSEEGACSGSDNDPNCWPHGYEGVIPGTAGEDYPILAEIVDTGFSCDEQQFSGYYADADDRARCQLFHICLKRNQFRKTQKWSFLCPNGTIFSQPDFVCVWWGDAPQCSDATVRSMYNLNEQLGWDNVTEGGGSKQGSNVDGGELQGAMSAFNSKKTAAVNTPPFQKQSSTLPYRVPVKVPEVGGRSRTKLQEVTQNALHGKAHELDLEYGGEHDGEESSNFETSLRKQSESRTRTKSGSALHKSVSEGYELKGSADGVQPFIVNRPQPTPQEQAPTEQPQYENQDVVMMPTMQRYPDGSEGYAEVPVMLPHHHTTGAYPTTTDPTHANLQQADGYDPNADVGYHYPNPTSTPAPTYLPPRRSSTQRPPPTTTEYFPPPTVPTEPPIPPSDPDHDNYEEQNIGDRYSTTEQSEDGYRYPQPTTTENNQVLQNEDGDGYRYPNPNQSAQQQQQVDSDEGYRYPQPTTTEGQLPPSAAAGVQEEDYEQQGYSYSDPTSTQRSSRFRTTTNSQTTTEVLSESTTTSSASEDPSEDGYHYQAPTGGSPFESLRETAATTERQQDGYNYQRPSSATTERQEDGYNYQRPSSATTERQEDGYNYQRPLPTTTERQQDGYNYQRPSSATTERQQDGYNYPRPSSGTTEQQQQQEGYNYQRPASTTTTENYDYSTQQSADLVKEEDVVTSTTTPAIPTTTTTADLPAGGYLPPRTNELSAQDEDQQHETSASEEVDYEEEDEATNEVVTDSTSAANLNLDGEVVGGGGGEDEGGYSYKIPTSPASSSSTSSSASPGSPGIAVNGGALDSDEKLNEILKQIQSGGIEAVDASGKPIEFSKLKQLLLNSPRGSVELKGELDSATASSTEVSTTPLADQEGGGGGGGYQTIIRPQQTPQQPSPVPPQQQQQQQQPQQQPYYHTVTTATVLPNNNNNNNNLFTTNQPQPLITTTLGEGGSSLSSPSGFYLPPQNNGNTNNVPINHNSQNQQQQYYSGNNNNPRNNEIVQFVGVDPPAYEINLPSREFETHSVNLNTIDQNNNNNFNNNNNNNNQFRGQQPQPGYYQTQVQTQPTPQQQFFQQQQLPQNNYLPPSPQSSSNPPFQQDYERTNLVLPSPQAQRQPSPAQLQQTLLPAAAPPIGEYLPPRQATSSILQPQYYQQSHSANSRPFVSPPIQLTDNIQLQQSYALSTQQPLLPSNSNPQNPLVDPKNIKIVPALFVHQHTSVAAQANDIINNRGTSGDIEDAFQTLDTAQSNYYNKASAITTSNLAQRLTSLGGTTQNGNNGYSTVPRQFFRRSNSNNSNNNNNKNGGGGGSNGSSSTPSHTIEQAHQVTSFTLEDARTPEELQQYHHQDLKRFHTENIVDKHGSILDDSGNNSNPPTTTRATSLPVVSTIARQPPPSSSSSPQRQQHSSSSGNRSGRNRDGGSGGKSSSSSTSTGGNISHRFSVSADNLNSGGGGGGSGSNGDIISSHRNEDYFIPVSGSLGGGGGSGGPSSSSSGRSRSSSSSNSGSTIRNSNNNNDNNSDFSQFRVSGGRGRSGRSGGGGAEGSTGSTYHFVDAEENAWLSRYLPEEQGGFGSRLL